MPKNAGFLLGLAVLLTTAVPIANRSLAAVQPPSSALTIDHWETDDGLPASTVTSILQTRDGYLWLGTVNGLVRFDGTRFSVFDQSNTPGLASSQIVYLFEDSQETLWVGTQTGGIVKLSRGQISNTGIGQYTPEQRLAAACEDSSGAIWLYTSDGQLWRYFEDGFSSFLFDADQPTYCRNVISDTDGHVWIGTDQRLAQLDADPVSGQLEPKVQQEIPVRRLNALLPGSEGGHWRLADNRVRFWRNDTLERDLGAYPWGSAPVSAVCEDNTGNLVVGTLGVGVFWYRENGDVAWLTKRHGLSSDVILSLCVDAEGNLWVGTDARGLNRVKRQAFETLSLPSELAIQSVADDGDGGLWIGSPDRGLLHWHNGELKPVTLRTAAGIPSVWSVLLDHQHTLWVGTRQDGLFHSTDSGFQRPPGSDALHPDVFALYQDRRGILWVGTGNGLGRWNGTEWRIFTTEDGLTAGEIRAIAEDHDGTLWIGTTGGGLNRLTDNSFTAHRQQDGLPAEDVSSLHVDAEGVLWVGTRGGGLGRCHQAKWTRYTVAQGLASNTIGYIVEDTEGYLWIGSPTGLMRIPKSALNAHAQDGTTFVPCRVYGRPDGLPTRECSIGSQPSVAQSPDGRLWFPSTKGIGHVHPEELQPNSQPPPVVIESVLIDGVTQEANPFMVGRFQRVTVPASKERLEIHYTSLNLRAPEKARFRYRLEGHETEWTEAGDRRVAPYSKLPPGDYQFQVTACNEDNVWNNLGSTLAVTVVPPLWRTWWFLSLSTLALVAAIAGTVHYLSTQKLQRQLAAVRQAEALEKERTRIAQDIHDQLGANLTQVGLLSDLVESDKDNPSEVEEHARQISQTARETSRVLDEIVWAVNPSNDTLEGLVNYVCKNAQEYLRVAGLRYRLDVPSELPHTPIPPEVRHNVYLAAKEAVTNVVRHANASLVWIRFFEESKAWVVEIEDNGCGLAQMDPKRAQTRNGLGNMRRRMEDIQGNFELKAGLEGGTLVRLVLRLKRV